MSDPAPSSPRRVWMWTRRVFNALTVAVLVLALIGQCARDWNIALALMMYVPVLPVGLAAVMVDAFQRGRAVPRMRFALLSAGVIAGVWGLYRVTSFGTRSSPPDADAMRLLQWNVQWGGLQRDDESWSRSSATIIDRQPDIIVLNEAPDDERIKRLCATLPGEWRFIVHDELQRKPYYRWRVMVASRWPLRLDSVLKIPNGGGVVVVIDAPQRRYRVLAADGISEPRISRTPMLHAIASHCDGFAQQDEAIDIIAGDFNAVGQSIGFDAFRQRRYARAAHASSGWIGSYPSWCPLYDIDHVWVSPKLSPQACEMFSSPTTNHRGQLVLIDESSETTSHRCGALLASLIFSERSKPCFRFMKVNADFACTLASSSIGMSRCWCRSVRRGTRRKSWSRSADIRCTRSLICR